MSFDLNSVNRFPVNSLGVNEGTMRPGGFHEETSAEFTSLGNIIFSTREDLDADAFFNSPLGHDVYVAVDIDADVTTMLKDWLKVNEEYISARIEASASMMSDLWVKMFFYPINNTSGMDVSVVTRKIASVEDIEADADFGADAFLKRWVEYIGAESEMFAAPILGIISDVGIGEDTLFSAGGYLRMGSTGTIIANNPDSADNFATDGNVYVDGYLKLQLHTKDCPIYP